ncbi:MAG: 50S ribosomal protein L17 [Limisphaerales bacterium]
MRHLKKTAKLGRTFEHRNRMLTNLVSSLIKHRRIQTTLAKAKAAQRVAERMLTLGKRGNAAVAAAESGDATAKAIKLAENVHCRRLVAARLHQQPRSLFKSKVERLTWKENEDVVHILFDKIAPVYRDRSGGYTRIVKIARLRRGDAGQLAILEWVDLPAEIAAASAPAGDATPTSAEGSAT